MRRADLDEGVRSDGLTTEARSDGLTTEARSEMSRLRRENRRLRVERDISTKKGSSLFQVGSLKSSLPHTR